MVTESLLSYRTENFKTEMQATIGSCWIDGCIMPSCFDENGIIRDTGLLVQISVWDKGKVETLSKLSKHLWHVFILGKAIIHDFELKLYFQLGNWPHSESNEEKISGAVLKWWDAQDVACRTSWKEMSDLKRNRMLINEESDFEIYLLCIRTSFT